MKLIRLCQHLWFAHVKYGLFKKVQAKDISIGSFSELSDLSKIIYRTLQDKAYKKGRSLFGYELGYTIWEIHESLR